MKQNVLKNIMESEKNLIYPIYEGQEIMGDITEALGYDLQKIVDTSFNKLTTVHTLGKCKFETITFLGLGKAEEITTRKMRTAFETFAKDNKEEKVFIATTAVTDGIDACKVAELFAESYYIGAYKEHVFGHESKIPAEVEVWADTDVQKAIHRGEAYAAGINHARKLADTPSNRMTPAHLAEEAQKLASQYDNLECEIFDKEALEKMGAGAILAVNQGSNVPACMIVLKYNGCEGPYKAVVGKGLTFDSGGYNIKSNSLGMKYDMCGGADVLGIMQILAATKAKTNVYGIVPSTENLVSDKAYKPQDVLKTLSGKTVEITNTDAEGRVILCDALTYAQQLGATHVIDMATLTGACVRALGSTYTGVFSNDEEFYEVFKKAMEESDEKGWRLPLDDDYFEMLKSTSADIKNSAGKPIAGASVAAGFLNFFIEKGTKWIHLDIAGTADHDGKAATGAMVRSVVNVLQK